MLAAAGTAFYMFRMFYLTFHGKFRGTHEQEHHLHESPLNMTLPLMILAVLSTIGGFIGFPHALGETMGIHHWLDHFLSPSVVVAHGHMAFGTELVLAAIAMGIAGVMIYMAHSIYISKNTKALEDHEISSPTHKLLLNKYYFDELYHAVIRKPLDQLGHVFTEWMEHRALRSLVDGTGTFIQRMGEGLRLIHNGQVYTSLLAVVLGIVALIYFLG
jgi:NADH-quinone oxidoreductase subunit L